MVPRPAGFGCDRLHHTESLVRLIIVGWSQSVLYKKLYLTLEARLNGFQCMKYSLRKDLRVFTVYT